MIITTLVVLLIYFRSLHGEFIADDAAVKDAEELYGKYSTSRYTPWPRRWSHIWRHSPRAVTLWLNQINWKLAGFRPWAWHLINILIHLVNCFLLYRLFSWFAVPYTDLAVAAFAVHPLQVPAVAWISGRAGMLAAMFGYLSWLMLLTDHGLLAMLAGLLAIQSKEEGFLYLTPWPILLILSKT